MNLNYTPEALLDLETIREYIAQDSEIRADQVAARILQAMEIIADFPDIGRPGRVEETREWSVRGLPYVGVYRKVSVTDIDVIAIVHTRRNWP